MRGAGVRPLRTRLGRAPDHRAADERPLGLARLLDRRRRARRARREGGCLALHRAPALQGHALLRRAEDRRGLRRDGWGAERGDVARAHGCLRARSRPPSRGRTRRDGGHGLLADLRGSRLRARGGAGGDRDGRGRAAGPRPRSVLRGRLPRAPARASRDRPGRGDLLDRTALGLRVSPRRVRGREHRPRRRGEPRARHRREPAGAFRPASGRAAARSGRRCARRSSASPRPACASSARTPSSSTSA